MIKIQLAPKVDNISDDGHVVTQMPYPFFVSYDGGFVQRQDFWNGDPYKVIGFQRDLAVHEITVTWNDARDNLASVVGMYLITSDGEGNWGTHMTAVDSIEPGYLV